jgi:ligand-binding sensor domain-containing protein
MENLGCGHHPLLAACEGALRRNPSGEDWSITATDMAFSLHSRLPLRMFFFSAVVIAWQTFFSPLASVAASEYLVDVWDASSGLPESTVTAIAQTSDGYIWVGTQNGLARFDGVRFVTFNHDNTPVLKNPGVESLCLDQQGPLWVGGVGQLAFWDGENFGGTDCPLAAGDKIESLLVAHTNEIAFATSQGCLLRAHSLPGGKWDWSVSMSASDESKFAVDAGGVIWRLNGDGRLLRLAGKQSEPVSLPGEAGRITDLVADAAGRLWLGAEGGLFYSAGGTFHSVPQPPGGDKLSVSRLVPTADGALWVMTDDHLWKLQNQQWLWGAGAFPEHSSSLRLLMEDRAGRLWFSRSGGGLLRLDQAGRTTILTTQDGLSGDHVRCLFQDHEGNLWAGIDRGGLVRLREKRFTVLGTAEGLAAPVVLSVCEDKEGTVWAGAYGGGLNRWSNGKFTSYDIGKDGSKGDVFAVFPDRQGRLWIGTGDNGVFVLGEGEFQRPFPANAIPGQIRAIFEDHSGTIWFGSTAGLYFWSWQQGTLTHVETPTELAHASVGCIAEDNDGTIWIGTHGQGLHQIKAGQEKAFHVKDGLPNEFVHSLLADADGTVWVGMYGGGLLRCKHDHLAAGAPRINLPDDVICHLADDHNGWLWISSHRSLFRVAKADLNAYADGQRKTVAFTAYGKFDGLPTVEFCGGQQPSGWNGEDGRLWFTTVKGLVSLQPNSGTVNPLPPPVVIESLLVNDELFAASSGADAHVKPLVSGLKIPAGQIRIEFQFTGLSFTAPDKVRFQYWLKGLENDWVDGGMNRSAAYSYLPPGKYEFQVKAANNDGVWNNNGASLSFQVLPQFWQRWWFRLLIVTVVAAMVLAVHYFRLSRLREFEGLRLRIARDLHDDVGTNLASVAVMAEVMKTKPSLNDAMELRHLALRTVDSLRDIVWFVDPARDTVGELVTRMRDTARTLLPKIRVDFSANVPHPHGSLPPKFRHHVFPMFKETLHNIAAHAQASAVHITLDCDHGMLYLKIEDNGTGFVEAAIKPGNGLRNLRTRAGEMNGTVKVEGMPGKGTTVELSVPLARRRSRNPTANN